MTKCCNFDKEEDFLAFGKRVYEALEAYKASEAWRLENEADERERQGNRLISEAHSLERRAKRIRE